MAFLDQTIYSVLPNHTVYKDLYDLVKLYLTHQHSKSSQRNKSKSCRYNFCCLLTDKTILAVALDQTVDILGWSSILTKRNNTLQKVKQYIDEFSDPIKTSYVNNLTENKAFPQIHKCLRG